MQTVDRFSDDNPNFWISPIEDHPEDTEIVEIITECGQEKLAQYMHNTLMTDKLTGQKFVRPPIYAMVDPADSRFRGKVKFWRKIL